MAGDEARQQLAGTLVEWWPGSEGGIGTGRVHLDDGRTAQIVKAIARRYRDLFTDAKRGDRICVEVGAGYDGAPFPWRVERVWAVRSTAQSLPSAELVAATPTPPKPPPRAGKRSRPPRSPTWHRMLDAA